MLFKRDTLDQIAAGRVTIAYRRWSRPSVKPGGQLKTAAGMLSVDKVERVPLSSIKVKDAQRAGYPTRAALLATLGEQNGDLYRVSFRRIASQARPSGAREGARRASRKSDKPTKKEIRSLIAELNRLDRERPWTKTVLRLIDKYPARRPPDLAASIGRDPLDFTRDARKLNDLGLTEALEIGYRLSPRGRAVLTEIFPQPAASEAQPRRPVFRPALALAMQRAALGRSPDSRS